MGKEGRDRELEEGRHQATVGGFMVRHTREPECVHSILGNVSIDFLGRLLIGIRNCRRPWTVYLAFL